MEKIVKYNTDIDKLLNVIIEQGTRLGDYIALGAELDRIKNLPWYGSCYQDLQAMLKDSNMPTSVLSRAKSAFALDSKARSLADVSDPACPLNNGLVGLGWTLYQLAGKTLTIIKAAIKNGLLEEEITQMFLDSATLDKKAWLAKYVQAVEDSPQEVIDAATEKISSAITDVETLNYAKGKLLALLAKRTDFLTAEVSKRQQPELAAAVG